MSLIIYSITLSILAGLMCLLVPRKIKGVAETLSVIVSLITFVITVKLFNVEIISGLFLLDKLSRFIILGIGLFGFLIALYSLKYMSGRNNLRDYYAYLMITIGASIGAVLSNHFILLLVFWGVLGLTLYMLINIGGPDASAAAKKAFVIIGGSDVIMILGLAIIWGMGRSYLVIENGIRISMNSGMAILAFICLAIAAFAKAGAMPLHTWIPDCAEKAPVPVTAFLPASLDKLVGIYFLGRISMNMFEMNKAMGNMLLIIGAITIVAAVMMALVQHDFKKLLGYHAISQVGYMILGIGTGNPIGIAGGLFHMLNNVIYKSCLFLGCGAVEKKTKTTDLDKLGGLARFMPVTFVTFVIAALAISGVPPFNGFVSKWMIYQGIIELGKDGSKMWLVWMVAAMFGSALTLASFMKLIHAVFLGQREEKEKPKEVSFIMWLPMVVLAALCVIFGVAAFQVPLKNFILPAVPGVTGDSFTGLFSPGLVTLMLLLGIILGLIIYLLSNLKGIREDSTPYIGGEILPEESRVTGVDFYRTVQDFGIFKRIYGLAEKKMFDIYEVGKIVLFYIIDILKHMHSGLLSSYVSWVIAGVLILLVVLMKGSM